MRLFNFIFRGYSFLYFQSWSRGYWSPPDRKFLVRKIFPTLRQEPNCRNVLFVGVHRYTKDYERYFDGQRFITIDFDPQVEQFGAQEHILGDVLELDRYQPRLKGPFDLVFLNGVIGYGLNEEEKIDLSFEKIAEQMRPGACLVLGSNPDRISADTLLKFRNLNRYFGLRKLEETGSQEYRFTLPMMKGACHQYRFYERL